MADIKQISDKALIRDIENASFAAGVKYAKDQESTPEYKDNLEKEAQYRVEIMRRLADFTAARQQRDDARRQRDALRQQLKAVEWVYRDGELVCPGCEHIHPRHAVNCGLAAALALVSE